jgi:hypothetical protein
LLAKRLAHKDRPGGRPIQGGPIFDYESV